MSDEQKQRTTAARIMAEIAEIKSRIRNVNGEIVALRHDVISNREESAQQTQNSSIRMDEIDTLVEASHDAK